MTGTTPGQGPRRAPRVTRELAVDAGLAALLLVVAVIGSRQATVWQRTRPLDALGYGLLVVAMSVLVGRRRWPVRVLAASLGACALWLALGYARGPIFLAPAVALGTLALHRPVRQSATGAGAAMAVLLLAHVPELAGGAADRLPTDLPVLLAWAAGWTLVPWAVGVGLRQVRTERDRERAETARRIAYEERLRVAREVHDVVGHGLSMINMRAGVALHVLDKRPDETPAEARAALEAIRAASGEALEDLRGTLAVFRRADAGDPGDGRHPPDGSGPGGGTHPDGASAGTRHPTPGLDQLGALVDQMRRGGLPVALELRGTDDGIPGAVGLAAYRIVQESLTNVVRHAGPAAATVRVVRRPDGVEVEVTDDGRGRPAGPGRRLTGAGGGTGITGMRERAAAVGGHLEAGPLPGGGFRVRAYLPLGAGAP